MRSLSFEYLMKNLTLIFASGITTIYVFYETIRREKIQREKI